MEQKHFVFILNLPFTGKTLMWPAYYEDLSEDDLKSLNDKFEEIDFKVTDLMWSATLANSPYKVFTRKTKNKKHGNTTDAD